MHRPPDLPAAYRTLADLLPPIDLFWALEPNWANEARGILARIDWAQHAREFREARALAVRSDAGSERRYRLQDGVAVLPLTGPMTKRPQSWGEGTSTVQLRRAVRQAAADPEVGAILLHVDSPGGQAAGTLELAADVARAAKKKPVTAYIEDLGASAAYWVASQARQVYANSAGLVGSIGTYAAITDLSRMADNLGMKVHIIRAGAYKGAGEPGTEITGEQLAEWQRIVDGINEHFLAAVGQGRNLPGTTVQGLADGRIHLAAAAKELGLIDGVRTLDTVLAGLRREARGAGAQQMSAQYGARPVPVRPARQERAMDDEIQAAEERIRALEGERDAERARATTAEGTLTAVLTEVGQEVTKAGIRAGMPAKLVERAVQSFVAARDWPEMKAYWNDARETAATSIPVGTSADRKAATARAAAEPDSEGDLTARLRQKAREREALRTGRESNGRAQ